MQKSNNKKNINRHPLNRSLWVQNEGGNTSVDINPGDNITVGRELMVGSQLRCRGARTVGIGEGH